MNTLSQWLVTHHQTVRLGWVVLLVLLAACNNNSGGDGGGGY